MSGKHLAPDRHEQGPDGKRAETGSSSIVREGHHVRLIIDTDPAMGVVDSDPEDAFALAFALNSPELQVAGVTAVNGNVPVRLAHANARHVLDLLDRSDIPLSAGPARPLMPHHRDQLAWQAKKASRPVITPRVSPDDPQVGAPQQIIETLLNSEEPTTVLAIGPLTNLALAALLEPRIVSAVERLVIMGGKGRAPGNVTPAAEFNFWCDPEAAQIVLAQGWPITMVTLEVCHQVVLTRDQLIGRDLGTPMGAFAQRACASYFDLQRQLRGFPLFDSLAAAVVLDPSLVRTTPAHVVVETSPASVGADVCWLDVDVLGEPLPSTNVDLATEVDAGRFMTLFTERVLARL